jgi:NAD(P)-dependent dehydrogenase (short-subunit alcohol dehydrogenase family)
MTSRVAIVTGGLHGLGRGVALGLPHPEGSWKNA